METQVASTSHITAANSATNAAANTAAEPAIHGKYLLLSLLIASRWVVYGFTDVALTAVLRKSGVSLAQISLMLGVGVLFMFKLVLLCTVVWLCLSQLPLNSIGFLVGMSTVLPSTLVLTAVRALERAPTTHPPHGERRL